MKAVILVGGLGTRLLPLTCNTPKAMMPILNRPFMEHLIVYLKKHGVDEVVLAMGYLPDPIEKGLGDGSRLGVKLVYSVEPKALGTAGAVKYAAQHIRNEPFFVFNGDVITDIDLTEMRRKHDAEKPKISIALTPVENPSAFGVVETNERGMVRRFIEKPPPGTETTNMINAGIYILEPDILEMIPEDTFYMFEKSVFPPLLEAGGKMLSYSSKEYWIDIGTPQKYLQVQYDILNRTASGRIVTQGRNRINPFTTFEGPVMIGPGCSIAQSVIKGPMVLGPRCSIAVSSTLEKTVMWEGVQIGQKSVLKECVIGANVKLGSDCEITAGTVIGDNVVLGDNCTTTPGTKIWPDRKIPSKTQLSGEVGKPA
jgi:mannose-1-phosphate guanylyltransferase